MAALNEFKKIIREAGSILARGENRLDTIIGRYLQWLEPRRKKSGPTKYRLLIAKAAATAGIAAALIIAVAAAAQAGCEELGD